MVSLLLGLVGWGCGALFAGNHAWRHWQSGRWLLALLSAVTAVLSALMMLASIGTYAK